MWVNSLSFVWQSHVLLCAWTQYAYPDPCGSSSGLFPVWGIKLFAERFLREHVIFSLLGSGVSESCGKHVSNPVPSSRGIFLTQGSNLCLLQFRQILYHGSHQGSSLNTVGNCQMILQNVCVICVPANDEWAFLLLCTFTILAWLVFNF